MLTSALVALTAGLFGQIPLATEAELPNGEKVLLAADQLLYEPSRELLTAKGNTLLRTSRLTVRADEVVYDQANQRAWAKGNVMMVSGLLAAVADEIRVDLQTLEAEVEGGLFLRKQGVTEEQLLAARTPQELMRTGQTLLTITGRRIKQVGPERFEVDGLSFTPCDCDADEPSWRVEARRADVQLGERAILNWPVVYVYRLPILAVPWLYLPLTDRRTGLLVPRPNSSTLNGFSLEQPFFLTLGESYDLTFTPGGYLGGEGAMGIRGGRLHTELRYHPRQGMEGRATLGLLYDLRARRDPAVPEALLEGARGLRGEASWLHTQELGGGWRSRLDLGVVSDGYYIPDITADILARQAEYLRSTAVVARRDHGTYLGLEAVVRQPIWSSSQPFGFDLFRENRTAEGAVVQPPRTFARAPALVFSAPERPLAGRLRGSFRAEAVRLGPLLSSFGDEGADGIFGVRDRLDPDGTQGNRRFDPGEREARERLDLNPRLSAPLAAGRFALFTPYLAARETLWLGEVSGKAAHRGYPLLGTMAQTTLVGDFGGAEGLHHRITPFTEVRWVPFVLGGLPGAPYDEVDRAIPAPHPELNPRPGLLQAVAEVRQELGTFRQGAYRELLRLDLGQGYDLQSGEPADSYGHFTLSHGPFTASGTARYDLPSRRWSQLSARLHLDNGRGTSLFASYDDILDVGSDPLRAGVDALVGTPLSLIPATAAPGSPAGLWRRAQQFHGGLRALFPFGLGVRYEAVVHPAATRKLAQQLVGLSYGPGCDCWRLELHASLRPDPAFATDRFLGGPFLRPDFGASLVIHTLGHFGTGG